MAKGGIGKDLGLRIELEIGKRVRGAGSLEGNSSEYTREAAVEVVKRVTFKDRFEFNSQFSYLLIVVILGGVNPHS